MARQRGDEGNNTLTAGNKGDWLLGRGGDDLLIGGAAGDTLTGGTGVDTLRGGDGNDRLNSGKGDPSDPDGRPGDSLDGGAGNDIITIGTGDVALGGEGADNIYTDRDATVFAGAGDDTVWYAAGGAGGLYDGGDGHDTLYFSFTSNAPFVGDTSFQADSGDMDIDGAAIRGFEAGIILFGDGDDVVTVSGPGSTFQLNGGLGDDHMIGSDQSDSLQGGAGADTIEGGGGDDELGASGPQSLLLGQGGNDSLRCSIGFANTLNGGAGDDTVAGAGLLEGGQGADLLIADQFDEAHSITLVGGAGEDTYRFDRVSASPAAAPALIKDQSIASVDLSRIDAKSSTSASNEAFHVVQALDGHAGELTIAFSAANDLTTVAGDVDGDGQADIVILIKGDYSDPGGFVL